VKQVDSPLAAAAAAGLLSEF